jgi:hypothetical protein
MFVWLVSSLKWVRSEKGQKVCLAEFLATNGVGVKGVKSETLMFVWLVSSLKWVWRENGQKTLMFIWQGF